jgi:hypothetical protein
MCLFRFCLSANVLVITIRLVIISDHPKSNLATQILTVHDCELVCEKQWRWELYMQACIAAASGEGAKSKGAQLLQRLAAAGPTMQCCSLVLNTVHASSSQLCQTSQLAINMLAPARLHDWCQRSVVCAPCSAQRCEGQCATCCQVPNAELVYAFKQWIERVRRRHYTTPMLHAGFGAIIPDVCFPPPPLLHGCETCSVRTRLGALPVAAPLPFAELVHIGQRRAHSEGAV